MQLQSRATVSTLEGKDKREDYEGSTDDESEKPIQPSTSVPGKGDHVDLRVGERGLLPKAHWRKDGLKKYVKMISVRNIICISTDSQQHHKNTSKPARQNTTLDLNPSLPKKQA